ncbi:hypothetical protein [Phenylobacterium sp.]|uniref:hypothetical protein n=1 Tax=Phenylobacterium sp. TaxID=1871053 RepID=UPI002ED9DC27
MPGAGGAAKVFAGLTAVVILFQLALAAGAPWGAYAMGGAFPGTYPPAMRVAAVVQAAILAGVAAIVLARGGVAFPTWRPRLLAWAVVALLAVGVVLNLITPSGMERLIWAPVAALLFLCGLRVALSR